MQTQRMIPPTGLWASNFTPTANGHDAVLGLLLSQRGSQEAVRICDVRGSTPAHDAAQNGHVTCLRLLVEFGLDIHQRDEVRYIYFSFIMYRETPNPYIMFVEILNR